MSEINQLIVNLIINIEEQLMYCIDHQGKVLYQYPVSTAANGAGNQNGSYKTPLGLHSIAQKIGENCALNEVFVGRQPLGALDDLLVAGKSLPEDIITSRILWLQGEEPGVNQGEGIDSYQRYIYIHGTPEEDKIGSPVSHGCVRMRNKDIAELYEHLDEGCRVLIQEKNDE